MDKHNRRTFQKWSLLSIGLFLICFGLFLSSKNAYSFLKAHKKVEESETHVISAQKQQKAVKEKMVKKQILYPTRPKKGDIIGELFIPKLDSSLPIIHGTDEDDLEKGVGHFAGSVLPGEEDNSVLAGHRDTVFRKLGDVGVNDRLIVKTSAGTFTYKVRKVRIVDSDDRTVIVSTPRATLTVSTCYPFSFIGPAPQRYVLVADIISKK